MRKLSINSRPARCLALVSYLCLSVLACNNHRESVNALPLDFTGFWKWRCSDDWGVQIQKQTGNLFSVSFCGPGGCFEPGTWMPNTPIVGDPRYRYINPTTLAIQHGDGWQTLTKCSSNTNPVMHSSTAPSHLLGTREEDSSDGVLQPSLGIPEPDCGRTATMHVYSDAYLSEETGDVGGIELAMTEKKDSSVDALMFVYEGAPNHDAIPLSGTASNKQLKMKGNWVEHLVEYPSKKEIVQTHSVAVDGAIDSSMFEGDLKIEGLDFSGKVQLKRVPQIWLCRTTAPAPTKP